MNSNQESISVGQSVANYTVLLLNSIYILITTIHYTLSSFRDYTTQAIGPWTSNHTLYAINHSLPKFIFVIVMFLLLKKRHRLGMVMFAIMLIIILFQLYALLAYGEFHTDIGIKSFLILLLPINFIAFLYFLSKPKEIV